jgi:hypothetical protein
MMLLIKNSKHFSCGRIPSYNQMSCQSLNTCTSIIFLLIATSFFFCFLVWLCKCKPFKFHLVVIMLISGLFSSGRLGHMVGRYMSIFIFIFSYLSNFFFFFDK